MSLPLTSSGTININSKFPAPTWFRRWLLAMSLFIVKKGGLSSSYDIKTGKANWELARIKNIGDYFASPVAGDGKIYVAGENGFIVVLSQGPKLEVLAKNDMGETCIASPAIADGRIFIRTRESLYCVSTSRYLAFAAHFADPREICCFLRQIQS